MKADAKKFQRISRSRYNPTADMAIANIMREERMKNKRAAINTKTEAQCRVIKYGSHGGGQRGI